MRIGLASIHVTDQAQAETFYTDVLGFETMTDVPLGSDRWLTVGDPEADVELLLEPNTHPAASAYQSALHDDGIPATLFFSSDIESEFQRLRDHGVDIHLPLAEAAEGRRFVFDDTVGNLVGVHEE